MGFVSGVDSSCGKKLLPVADADRVQYGKQALAAASNACLQELYEAQRDHCLQDLTSKV